MKPLLTIILTLLAAALIGCEQPAIQAGSQSGPAVYFAPGAIVLQITVPAGAIPVNAPVTLTVDPTIYINGHVFGTTKPATEPK